MRKFEINSLENKESELRVLHLLNISLPNLSGYSIRSHNILLHQKLFALSFSLTSPKSFPKKNLDIINNIIYFRYPPDMVNNFFFKYKIFEKLRISKLFDIFYFSCSKIPLIYLRKIVEVQKPDIIHGHSTAKFAKFGEKIARKTKIPFIYEVRGFVEDTLVEQGFIRKNSLKYLIKRRQENNLMKKANLIVTLGKYMKIDLVKRGFDEKKIFIVSNAVDTNLLYPIKPNVDLKKKFGLHNKLIIGYVGSIRRIEGLETLFKAVKILRQNIKNLHVMIIGKYTTKYFRDLKILIKELQIEKNISFSGLVPNNKIQDYYSILDIIVIPRIDSRVTRLVTPLKPLEAMAMGKVLITSDLPALKELVKPNISGDNFKVGNPHDLANILYKYLSDSDLRYRLGLSARKYVENYYDWRIIIKKYLSLYERLLN